VQRVSESDRPPLDQPPRTTTSQGARRGQLAAFAAVVVGAGLTGYWLGRSGVPVIRPTWSTRPTSTVAAPLTPCLPAVDIEATPEEPAPTEATASAARSAEPSAKPSARATATSSASTAL